MEVIINNYNIYDNRASIKLRESMCKEKMQIYLNVLDTVVWMSLADIVVWCNLLLVKKVT